MPWHDGCRLREPTHGGTCARRDQRKAATGATWQTANGQRWQQASVGRRPRPRWLMPLPWWPMPRIPAIACRGRVCVPGGRWLVRRVEPEPRRTAGRPQPAVRRQRRSAAGPQFGGSAVRRQRSATVGDSGQQQRRSVAVVSGSGGQRSCHPRGCAVVLGVGRTAEVASACLPPAELLRGALNRRGHRRGAVSKPCHRRACQLPRRCPPSRRPQRPSAGPAATPAVAEPAGCRSALRGAADRGSGRVAARAGLPGAGSAMGGVRPAGSMAASWPLAGPPAQPSGSEGQRRGWWPPVGRWLGYPARLVGWVPGRRGRRYLVVGWVGFGVVAPLRISGVGWGSSEGLSGVGLSNVGHIASVT